MIEITDINIQKEWGSISYKYENEQYTLELPLFFVTSTTLIVGDKIELSILFHRLYVRGLKDENGSN